jgi:hypothetical protein
VVTEMLSILDAELWNRSGPRRVAVFCGVKSAIVLQLFCSVSLIVKSGFHEHDEHQRRTFSISPSI